MILFPNIQILGSVSDTLESASWSILCGCVNPTGIKSVLIFTENVRPLENEEGAWLKLGGTDRICWAWDSRRARMCVVGSERVSAQLQITRMVWSDAQSVWQYFYLSHVYYTAGIILFCPILPRLSSMGNMCACNQSAGLTTLHLMPKTNKWIVSLICYPFTWASLFGNITSWQECGSVKEWIAWTSELRWATIVLISLH